ncbi:MAG: MerR family transcriptional regulator [Gemmatimonadota bacterium]
MSATLASASVNAQDPLGTLREYAALAPWSLRDLTALAGAILETSGIFPVNAAARARPTERTIRFYVARRLVSPPEGRGTAAIYGYRHLLQVLAIKLRQMDGVTLDALIREFAGLGGDVIERRVAGALGAALPSPSRLSLDPMGAPRGKVARALQGWHHPVDAEQRGTIGAAREARGRGCRRFQLAPGIELLVDEPHALLRTEGGDLAIAAALRAALDRLLGHESSSDRLRQ